MPLLHKYDEPMSGISSVLLPAANVSLENTITYNPSLFSFDDKLILAPMQGLTSLFFRKAYHECFPGCIDYAISPFISVTDGLITSKSRKFRDVFPFENKNSLEVVPQLLGSTSKGIISYGAILQELGYRQFNINCACPAKCAIKHGRGSALLKDLKRFDGFLNDIFKNVHQAVSIKIRIGFDSKADIASLADLINAYPLKYVVIHPRLAVNLYQGSPDYEAFGFLAERLQCRVVYNGDIFSLDDFLQVKQRFPMIKDFMLGRGILQNPLLAAEIRGLNFDKNMLKTLFFKLEDYYLKLFLEVGETERPFDKTKGRFILPDRQDKIAKALSDKMKELCKYMFGNNFSSIAEAESLSELNAIVTRMFL